MGSAGGKSLAKLRFLDIGGKIGDLDAGADSGVGCLLMMILTCPNCATRFFVERESIGPAGRKVKCSACATEWVAYRSDEGAAKDGIQAAVTESAPASAPAVDHPKEVNPPATESVTNTAPEAHAEIAPSPDTAPEPLWTGGEARPVAEASWPEQAQPMAYEPVESSAPDSEAATPLFADRSAVTTAPGKRRGRSIPLLLILLVLAVVVLAGLVYYRVHQASASAPAHVSATEEPGAIRG